MKYINFTDLRMIMNRDALHSRLTDLQKQKGQNESISTQANNNANACAGAIQEVIYWLNKLDEAEKLESEKEVDDNEPTS